MIRLFSRSAPGTLALAGVLAASAAARAENVPSPPGQREHEGLFVRLLLGPSYLVAGTIDQSEEDVTLSGYGATFQVAVGYNIIPRLVVFAEVFDDITVDPSLEIDGSDEELEGTTLGLHGVGLGLAYYLPWNSYISASAAASLLRAETTVGNTTTTEDSDLGFGVNVLVGQEFWVSDTWALGVGAQLYLGSVPTRDGDERESWGVAAVALGFSATYD